METFTRAHAILILVSIMIGHIIAVHRVSPPSKESGLLGRASCSANMGWVKSELATGNSVRGLIVAHDFSESIKYAVLPIPEIRLKRYEAKFQFEDVS